MPRFNIRQLMILVAIIAALLALIQNYPFAMITMLQTAGLAFVGWVCTYRRPRLATWGFAIGAAWLNLSMLLFFAYYPIFRNSLILFLCCLTFVAIVPGIGLAWLASIPGARRKAPAALLVIVLIAIPISMIATRWPLRLAFALSSAGLNRLADRVEAGGKVVPGEWAGIYRVWGSVTNAQTGDVVLLIDTNRSGIFGFARRRNAASCTIAPGENFAGGSWYSIDED